VSRCDPKPSFPEITENLHYVCGYKYLRYPAHTRNLHPDEANSASNDIQPRRVIPDSIEKVFVSHECSRVVEGPATRSSRVNVNSIVISIVLSAKTLSANTSVLSLNLVSCSCLALHALINPSISCRHDRCRHITGEWGAAEHHVPGVARRGFCGAPGASAP
jgi:hypothetical protein